MVCVHPSRALSRSQSSSDYVEDILLVIEDEIRHAVAFVQSRMKIVVEPSGAVPLPRLLAQKTPCGDTPCRAYRLRWKRLREYQLDGD